MKDKRVDIILEYLGLDKGFITDCFGDFDENECNGCSSFHVCLKEEYTRKKLREVTQ